MANGFDISQYIDSNGNPTDQSIVALTQAIKQTESGGNKAVQTGAQTGATGERGAYQWMPGNFTAAATKYGLDPSDHSNENQNKVAYLSIAEMNLLVV